ncbi:ABC transporter permease [Rhabdobacter roseus]|uniref:Putative ABC transport system permease protein n=1 Tax=Rhabdobacter roseus TaxID=1655419 RepID=A0A840TH71_9BACT|nr:ABC transporter permease [Rhabdobacter roseus]MBB5282305.1 putative ABC transport system permease protein [Rhabdobacter roseus]
MKPPPRWADRLLERFCAPHLLEEIQGDLHERFERRRVLFGERAARRQYGWEVLGFLRPFALKRKRNATSTTYLISHMMIQNYFKIAFRNLRKHKAFSFINIAGVALGLACFLMLALYVKDELSYDRHHAHADRIYRLSRTFLSKDGTVSLRLGHAAPPFGPLIKQDFPEVEEVVRMLETGALIRYGDHLFNENELFVAEQNLFKVFSFKVLSGNPDKALENPFSIMFSRPMAEKYFGKENPLGKVVRLDDQLDYTVTGVFEPLPAQSHFHPSFLISFTTLNDDRVYGAEGLRSNWGNNSFSTFLLLPEKYDAQKMVKAFPDFQNRHIDPKASTYSVLDLMKLTDIHLHSHLDSEIEANGDIQYVYLFSAIALFILIIACINYMNLATAKSATRAKEVGMRKVIGAVRLQLINQFLSESVLLVGVSVVLAVGIVVLCLPALNNFTQKQLSFAALLDPTFLAILVFITLFTGLVAGSYPAFFMTSFQPISVLKGRMASVLKNGMLRQTLVVAQFAIAVVLIISTVVVYTQMRYIQNYKLGYSKDQVVLLYASDDSTIHFESIKERLKANSNIREVGRSSRVPSGRLLDSWEAYVMKGDSMAPTDINIKSLSVDEDFIPTYQIEMAAGRNFSRDYATDKTAGFILNETAVRLLGWKNPADAVGNRFGYGAVRGQIIGVTKDYHFESLHQKVAPIVMFHQPGRMSRVSVQVSGGDLQQALSHIESVWQSQFPGRPFSYEFLDQRFGQLYAREQTQQMLFGIFAGIAIFISCLGLLGLSMFMAEVRTKEIGVRKVLGASVGSIVVMLSSDFLKLVLVAIAIASPIAWYGMRSWLQDFAYHTDISWWVYVLAGTLAVGIALLTVSFQSIKAALMNPVKSLRSE